MQQMQEPPEGMEAIRSRRRPPRRRAAVTLPDAWSAADIEAILASHQEAVAAQIEHGVRALHQTAARLMSELTRADEGVSPEDEDRAVLTHVDERYQALSLRMERLEGALRQLVQTFKSSMAAIPAELAERLDGMAEAIDGFTVQQRQDLESFTQRTGEGLARIAARSAEELARAAQRQEAALDTKLEQMLEAVETIVVPPPPVNGEAPSGADRAVSAFVQRLREAEQRLAVVTEDGAMIEGGPGAQNAPRWDPFEDQPPRFKGSAETEPA
jgi:hypothetical protein